MFLKIAGVTGEAGDAEHKGEIEVVSWSWGMQGSTSVYTGQATAKAALSDLQIVKHVDQSSPTLMSFMRRNKVIPEAVLTVRKAGQTPLTYFKITLKNARVTSIKAESEKDELVEHLSLGFSAIAVSYIPQSTTGAKGGGENVFEADGNTGQ
jgi:type VI secretion system secreted protein Hcp